MREKILIGVFIVLIVYIGAAAKVNRQAMKDARSVPLPSIPAPKERIHLGETEIYVDVADTSEERNRGLSRRPQLFEGEGLLFIFETPGRYGFWMKDMNFPIDIIWIDAEKKIVRIDKEISPETYPNIFKPQTDILYVLEVPAGFSQGRNIEVGEMFFYQ